MSTMAADEVDTVIEEMPEIAAKGVPGGREASLLPISYMRLNDWADCVEDFRREGEATMTPPLVFSLASHNWVTGRTVAVAIYSHTATVASASPVAR